MNEPDKLPDLPEKLIDDGPTLPEEPGDLSPPDEEAGSRALAEAMAGSFRIIRVLLFVLAIGFLFSGIFVVEPNQAAVVLRMGKATGTGSDRVLSPGMHWAFPYPVDEVVRIPVGESRTVESTNSWYRVTEEMLVSGALPPSRSSLQPGADGYALCGDGNIIHVRASARYRIEDPVAFTFDYLDAPEILQSALDNAVLHTAARFSAEDALYRDRAAFVEAIRLRFIDRIGELAPGVRLEEREGDRSTAFEVEASAPMYVKEAFDQVQEAEQTLSQTRNRALGEAEEILRRAEGERQAILSRGVTRSNQLVQMARADARFLADQREHYRAEPRLFTERLTVETLSTVLTNAADKWYLPRIGEGRQQLRLRLNREPRTYGGGTENDNP